MALRAGLTAGVLLSGGAAYSGLPDAGPCTAVRGSWFRCAPPSGLWSEWLPCVPCSGRGTPLPDRTQNRPGCPEEPGAADLLRPHCRPNVRLRGNHKAPAGLNARDGPERELLTCVKYVRRESARRRSSVIQSSSQADDGGLSGRQACTRRGRPLRAALSNAAGRYTVRHGLGHRKSPRGVRAPTSLIAGPAFRTQCTSSFYRAGRAEVPAARSPGVSYATCGRGPVPAGWLPPRPRTAGRRPAGARR